MSAVPEGMIAVEDFAKLKGISASKVVEMIRDGFYVGRKIEEEWLVDSSEISNNETKKSQPRTSSSKEATTNRIVVTDVQVPISSMVVFMVKWAIASIPALIILVILFTVITGVLGSF